MKTNLLPARDSIFTALLGLSSSPVSGDAKSPCLSTPPVNLATCSGASGLEAGPGVCTDPNCACNDAHRTTPWLACHSQNKNPLGSANRDSSGLRFVVKGSTVRAAQYPMLGKVVRVRRGVAWVDWSGRGRCDSWFTKYLLVVAV